VGNKPRGVVGSHMFHRCSQVSSYFPKKETKE
jgi:hypothetical protein